MVFPLLLIPLVAAAPALSGAAIAVLTATGVAGAAIGSAISVAIDRWFFQPSTQLNASLAFQNETTLKRIDEAQETRNTLRTEIQASTDAVNDSRLATTEAINPLHQSTENVLQTSGSLQTTVQAAGVVTEQLINALPVLREMSETVRVVTTDATASVAAISGLISSTTDNLVDVNSNISAIHPIITEQERTITELNGRVEMLTTQLDKQEQTRLMQQEINTSLKKESERVYNKSAFFKQAAQQAAPCMDEQASAVARTTAHTSV